MIYDDCFAYMCVNGNPKYSALTKINCYKCKFYRSKDDITRGEIEVQIEKYKTSKQEDC